MNPAIFSGSPTYLEFASVLISALWIFLLPGYLWSVLLRFSYSRDRVVAGALAIAVGMALWPVLLLWTSTFGLAWNATVAQLMMIGLGAAGFLFLWFRHSSSFSSMANLAKLNPSKAVWPLIFIFLAGLTFWTRHAHTQKTVLPNWVDSVHHGTIVRLLIGQGRVPDSFAPFMPESQFLYHWGYHALVAWMAWARGATDSFDAIHLMLVSGQVFSMAAVVMLYAAGRVAFGSRRAGILVAILGGLVSWFPAYYISWGRYTHLAGVLLLAPTAISLWKIHTAPKQWLGWVVTTAILAAGLILIHVRVAFFFVTMAGVLALYLTTQRAWRSLLRWVAAGAMALLLCAPWIWRLMTTARVSHLAVVTENVQQAWWSNFNDITWDLVWVPGIHELMALATAGISGILGAGKPPPWLFLASIIWLALVMVSMVLYWRKYTGAGQRMGSNSAEQRMGSNSAEQKPVRRKRAIDKRNSSRKNSSGRKKGKARQSSESNSNESNSSESNSSESNSSGDSTGTIGSIIQPRLLPLFPWRPLLFVLAWSLLTLLILNLDAIGLPTFGFLSNDAGVITLFAPVSMIAGGFAAWVLGILTPRRLTLPVTLLIVILAGYWGGNQMQHIVNPTTTLVRPADMQALRWIRENVPNDALFAVNMRRWLGSTYAGTDGGYWIPILSERASILPSSLYITSVPRDQAVRMNEFFASWSRVGSVDEPELRAQLKAMGVTHFYLGQNGGHLMQERFAGRPYLDLIYAERGVQIYRLSD